MKYIFILGRQPKLGLAELESLNGPSNVTPISDEVAEVDTDKINFNRIGGSIKVAKKIANLKTKNINKIKSDLANIAQKISNNLPAGKLKVGISAYSLDTNPRQLNAVGLSIKKSLSGSGRSVRIVPNKANQLSSAQVKHNKLTKNLGVEILLIADGEHILVAQTLEVQDIDSYAMRDRERPKRDAKVGMLPPKLAQLIINLAVGSKEPNSNLTVLDPFCGTGVILIEAGIIGFSVVGSDIDQRMIDYSQQNFMWAKNLQAGPKPTIDLSLTAGNATTLKWDKKINFVASEIYLGRPFTTEPSFEILKDTIKTCDYLFEKFLKNLYLQISPSTRLCLAVPAWFYRNKIYHLSTLDKLAHLGYNRISFVHVEQNNLIYHRPKQTVGRELVILERK